MNDSITDREFQEAGGVDDWRVLEDGANACFVAESFPRALELVARIGELADAANHHPDIDVRYDHVFVRAMTHHPPGLSRKDLDLARDISRAAAELGCSPDPSAVQHHQHLEGPGHAPAVGWHSP